MKITSILAGIAIVASAFAANADTAEIGQKKATCSEIAELMQETAQLREVGFSYDDAMRSVPDHLKDVAAYAYHVGETNFDYKYSMYTKCMQTMKPKMESNQ